MKVEEITILAKKLRENIENVIVDNSENINIIIATLLAGGHLLLEDVPGTGKTMLSRTLAKSIAVNFKRIQFTPDLLPSDLTGINYYNPKSSDFVLKKGAMFTNILLADEINRATPRTQSSLLESMEERQITIDGQTYVLEVPFFVMATQNPVETQGTYPLPEAQLDRFMVKLSLGYPSDKESVNMLQKMINGSPFEDIKPICSGEDIKQAINAVNEVYVHNDILEYVVKIATATRNAENIKIGLSSRGMIALVKMAKSYASVMGRTFVTPEDIKYLAPYVIGHRLILKTGNRDANKIVKDILQGIVAPTENWDVRR